MSDQATDQATDQARVSFLVMQDAERPWAIRASQVARIILPGEWHGAPPLDAGSEVKSNQDPSAIERLIVFRCASGERALRISSQLQVHLAEPAHVVPLPELCRPVASAAVSVVGLVMDANEIRFLIVEPQPI